MSKSDVENRHANIYKYFTTTKKKSNYFTIIFDSIIARTREARTHALAYRRHFVSRCNEILH